MNNPARTANLTDPKNPPSTEPRWDNLWKDARAVELAVKEQEEGKIGSDVRSLLVRAQEIKDTL